MGYSNTRSTVLQSAFPSLCDVVHRQLRTLRERDFGILLGCTLLLIDPRSLGFAGSSSKVLVVSETHVRRCQVLCGIQLAEGLQLANLSKLSSEVWKLRISSLHARSPPRVVRDYKMCSY